MKPLFRSLVIGSALLAAPFALHAQVAPAGTLSNQQLSDGLKAGLGAIISQSLGQGNVSVSVPPALAKIQAALGKTANADKAAGFSSAFSAAVAQVAPQAKGLMQSALKETKVDDPKAVLAGGADAGTQYLKKAMAPAVREKLLPLVKLATASSGLSVKAKDMLALAGPLAALGGSKAIGDLDGYLCDQIIEQSFALVGKQEATVRANPALLTDSALGQKVFSMFKK